MDRSKYMETEEQRQFRMNAQCLVFHGDGKCCRHIQPERSKREDCDLVYVDPQGNKTPVYDLFDPRRCGALNTVETQ